jgi:hypothetical protein
MAGRSRCEEPYLVSYITYVAATIHVRVLAADQSSQVPAFRDSRQALRVCLDALEENAKTNAGTSKARSIIQGLMAQMGVQVPKEETGLVPANVFGGRVLYIWHILRYADVGDVNRNPNFQRSRPGDDHPLVCSQ